MIDDRLLEVIACPQCRAPLTRLGPEGVELACTNGDCGLVYPVRDGVPVLLVDHAH